MRRGRIFNPYLWLQHGPELLVRLIRLLFAKEPAKSLPVCAAIETQPDKVDHSTFVSTPVRKKNIA